MGDYKILNIKGVLLDKNQLENYLQKLASDNILKNKSDKNTYPKGRSFVIGENSIIKL